MSIQLLKDRLPEYARDLKLNLGSLAAETALSEDEKAGVFIASAIASRSFCTIGFGTLAEVMIPYHWSTS
jgi:alkyl hydroperoxide reductase subunit D